MRVRTMTSIDPTESPDPPRSADVDARLHRDAIEQLAWAHRPLVVSVCRRYLRRPEDVEDAVQDTFVKLARRRATIAENVTGWLAAAAYSSCVDLIRHMGRSIGHFDHA
jgi:RNA polymerase sigma factor (sigma-70 family)